LPADARIRIIQRLVPIALSNPTVADTILGRLLLLQDTAEHLPPILAEIAMPNPAAAGSPRDSEDFSFMKAGSGVSDEGLLLDGIPVGDLNIFW
jgi:hypothetical protein